MPARNYSFVQHNVAFVMFDANACQWSVRRANPDALAQLQRDKSWLAETLAKGRAAARWLVLVQHHPFFTDGRGHLGESQCLRNGDGVDLLRVLGDEGARPDLVIAGHEHMMMAKQEGKTLHVCTGASIESCFYKGERRAADREMDWKMEARQREMCAFALLFVVDEHCRTRRGSWRLKQRPRR